MQHVSERNRGSNTGRLLETILPQTRVLGFGDPKLPFAARELEALHEPVVLFPRGDAVLQREDLSQGKTLVLLDASWSQGRRMARRVPGLERLRFVSLPVGEASNWRLRNAPRPHMLCTLEAASRSVAIAGDPDTAAQMMQALRLVELHGLHSRGFLTREELDAALVTGEG